ncbi:hypothetical protein [Mycolicibacter virginiensis]|uniref:hypothetical protein n=1 Tax=Mycolicibacter virginiensis TaxID=1795032 RepID=UPI00256F329D|nr:hypothetical protein [Mycolicibacter virginiensis]
MSGPRGGALGRLQRAAARTTATIVFAGFCLLVAPAAHADFEDLLDTVIGAASTGPDPVDIADLPAGSLDLDASGVLQDPLAQLDQVLHGEPGQLIPEPATAGTPAESNPGDPSDTNSGAPGDTTPNPGNGEHQAGNSENSNNPTSFPKFSMPGGGNGGGGSGGGGNGSGAPGANNAKTKSNTSAAKPGADLPKAEGDGVG